jgi:hypothetical protein
VNTLQKLDSMVYGNMNQDVSPYNHNSDSNPNGAHTTLYNSSWRIKIIQS